MIYVELQIVIDEDETKFEDVLSKIKSIDGVTEVEVVEDSYHEYNVDSDPFWEKEEC